MSAHLPPSIYSVRPSAVFRAALGPCWMLWLASYVGLWIFDIALMIGAFQ